MAHFSGDAKRCHHLIKVAGIARHIAQAEGISGEELLLIEAAGLVHDCGIVPVELKYGKGNCTGKIQEQEGPRVGKQILRECGFEEKMAERICHIIGHHHSYDRIDGIDFQILVEADMLVMFLERTMEQESIKESVLRIFRTNAGIALSRKMFAWE